MQNNGSLCTKTDPIHDFQVVACWFEIRTNQEQRKLYKISDLFVDINPLETRTSLETYYVSATKLNWLMLFRGIIYKHKQRLYGENAEF
jgi:hypothetical protein